MTDLPGGFPAAERQPGAVQARLTGAGLDVVHDNMAALTDQLLGSDGPLMFPIPRDCYSDPKVCCYVADGSCQLVFDIDERPGDLPRIAIEPIGGDQIQATIRARVRTASWLPVHARGPLGGEISCWVYIDSRWSGSPHVTIRSIIRLADDDTTGTTGGQVVSTTMSGISAGDVDIDGGLLCGFGSTQEAADNMNSQLAQRIPGAIGELLCSKCDSDNDCAPFGSCGDDGVCYLPDGACMQSFGTTGRMTADALFGSLASDHAGALDLYLTAGGLANTDGDGIQLGVLAGALPAQEVDSHACVPAVAAPELAALPASDALTSNIHPRTGEVYDLGLAIHKDFLDRAGWAAHQAGFLCLDVGAARVPLLNAESLAILAPSLIDLTHGEPAPLFLLIRPQTPPAIQLGAGTFSQTEGGEKRIDEPLLQIALTDLEVDFYAWIDDSYARILTLRTDVTADVGLDIDGEGRIIPVLGDLAESFDNIRVVNSGLLAETPDEIASRFPAVLSVALPQLGAGLDGFDVPALGGLTLELDADSLTSIDGDSMLGIFGHLAPAAMEQRRTVVAQIERAVVRADRPAVDLTLGADRAGVEWSVRIDGGYWSPYGSAARLTLERQAFRLLGSHTIEVRGREIGAPATTGAIDVIEVDVRARPAIDLASAPAIVGFHGTAGSDGGCDCRTGGGGSTGSLLLLGLVALGLGRRRRRALPAALVLLLAAVGCSSKIGGDGDDGELDPTVVNPGPTGRWASMASDGDRTVLAAYEQALGDLVLAEITAEGRPSFRVIDGAPEEPVLLDPTGYRGGVNAPGDDVGAWTTTAISGGSVVIAYQDRDRSALRLARESDGTWATHDVDVPTGDDQRVGEYASLVIDTDGRPAIAYMVSTHLPGEPPADENAPEDPGQIHAELRVARATSSSPSGPDDWTVVTVDESTVPFNPDFADVPVGTGAFAALVATTDGLQLVFYRQATGDLMLASETEDGWLTSELDAGLDRDRGQWASATVADDGALWIAYQDAVDDRLLALRWTVADGASAPEVVDDGRRDGDRPHVVGAGAALAMSDGQPMVAYQDASTADLLCATRSADGSWQRRDVLAGDIGYGFHIAIAAPWVSTYTYDQALWPPGHTEVRRVTQ